MKKRWIVLGGVGVIGVLLATTGFGQLFAIGIASMVIKPFTPGPPAIYNEATDHYRNWDDTEKALSHVLEKHYPPGTPATRMIADLQAQKFTKTNRKAFTCRTYEKPQAGSGLPESCTEWDDNWNHGNSLSYNWTRFPCSYTIDVYWATDPAGRITRIAGQFAPACI